MRCRNHGTQHTAFVCHLSASLRFCPLMSTPWFLAPRGIISNITMRRGAGRSTTSSFWSAQPARRTLTDSRRETHGRPFPQARLTQSGCLKCSSCRSPYMPCEMGELLSLETRVLDADFAVSKCSFPHCRQACIWLHA